jgi:uncharacterized membrane protein YhhN
MNMKPAIYLIPFLIVTVGFLIRWEFSGNRKNIYFIKPISTLLVIFAALLSFQELTWNTIYTFGVILGLVFSMGGDIALMFQEDKKAFRIGLVLFLLAHIVYTAIFTIIGHFSGLSAICALVVLFLGLGIYWMIQSNLGSMKGPVIAYIVIISLMVIQAVSVFSSPGIDDFHALMMVSGAVLFYISDVILAANRFWRPWKYNRISLAFYYSGQMLIVLSASYFVR